MSRTFYIAPATGPVPAGWANGNDANNGGTEITAFATRQGAWSYAQKDCPPVDLPIAFVLCDGTFTDDFTAIGPLSCGSESTVQFIGNYGTPDACLIDAPNSCWGAAGGAAYSIYGFKGEGGGIVIGAQSGGRISFGLMDFGLTNAAHIWAGFGGAVTGLGMEYVISGGAAAHYKLDSGGNILINPCTIWMPAPVGFTNFCQAGTGLGIFKGLSISGPGSGAGSTGDRYAVNEGAIVLVGGAGPNYFPGFAGSGSCDANSIYQ
jgi:hypothetical protein